MSQTKIAVVYYSTYGTNVEIAKDAAAAAREAGADVRLVKFPETVPQAVIDGQEGWKANQDATADIPEVTHDDLVWADGLFFAVPTRFGQVNRHRFTRHLLAIHHVTFSPN